MRRNQTVSSFAACEGKVAQQIASVKNQIHALINATFSTASAENFKDLFCKRGLIYLQTVALPEKDVLG